MLQHNHWGIDGWVPLQNIGARAGGPQDWCTPDTVCRNGAQTRQTGFTILCYSATIYHRMSAVSGIVFQSPNEALCGFLSWQNLHRIFFGDISKKITCSKFLPYVIRGPISSRGPLRTCVPCLMVNPALQSQPHSCDVSTLQTVLNAIST